MIIQTREFQEACKTILLAVDKNAANLELVVKGDSLYLNVTNYEYYVSVKFALAQSEEFRAVVDANLFLSLIAGITTDSFELKLKDNTVVVKSGKSNYKLALIYDNDKLMELPAIFTTNKTVEMPISKDVLMSILNVNGREVSKLKHIAVSDPLQSLYYINEAGCFTYTSGVCLNSFTLEKPVKMLLNDRIVHLFRLFTEDVLFSLGYDTLSDGSMQSKVSFETPNIYIGAIITNDAKLIASMERPYEAAKNFITENYPNHLVVSTSALNAAIARLMQFVKISSSKATTDTEKINMFGFTSWIKIADNELTIEDENGNAEVVTIENGSFVAGGYSMKLNLSAVKLVLESCKEDHITINCGNYRAIVLSRNGIYNLISEEDRT